MWNLPSVICVDIATYLSGRSRFSLQAVSREWHQVLQTSYALGQLKDTVEPTVRTMLNREMEWMMDICQLLIDEDSILHFLSWDASIRTIFSDSGDWDLTLLPM